MGMHSLRKTRMQDRNAEPDISSWSHFIRMAVHLKDIYVEMDFKPDWYPISVRCLALSPVVHNAILRTLAALMNFINYRVFL